MKMLLLLLMAFPFWCSAQIGVQKEEIIKKNGFRYYVLKDSSEYEVIYYINHNKTEMSGEYTWIMYFFFDKETHQCVKTWLIEPITEINSWIKLFNEKYVKQSGLFWKDFSYNVIHKIIKNYDTDSSYLEYKDAILVISKYEGIEDN